MPAEIAYENLADSDDTTITVADALPLAGASKLLVPHVGVKCRVNATSGSILFDLGSSVSVSTLAIAGVSGTDPDFRVRYSSVDSSGAAGDVYDSGTISGEPYFDSKYGLFVHLRPAALSTRYILFNQSEAAVSYTEWGRPFVGARSAFGINFQAPWRRVPVRRSIDTEGVGPQTFVDLRQGYWRQIAPFGFVSEDDANGFLEEIAAAIVNNGHKDMLWIKDPDSSNLSRDCLWGFHEGDWPRSQELYCVPPVFSLEMNIRQRG